MRPATGQRLQHGFFGEEPEGDGAAYLVQDDHGGATRFQTGADQREPRFRSLPVAGEGRGRRGRDETEAELAHLDFREAREGGNFPDIRPRLHELEEGDAHAVPGGAQRHP